MLNTADNLLLTSTGPQAAAGALMRRYWQPAALAEEFDGAQQVRCVELAGERFALFKDPDGAFGMLDIHCPHRGADLSYGRVEHGGLRCVFHGWLFDRDGKCLEQPGEPEGSRFHQHVHQRAYPCRERNGIVFAWLGDGPAPPLPQIDALAAPPTHAFAFKGLIDCNWMQALEVGIDPAHASYLHRFLQDDDPADGYGQQFRSKTALTDMPMTQLMRDFPRPRIIAEETDYGLRIAALRDLDEEHTHVRVTNLLFPHAIVISMSDSMTITQWHVPIDDRRCYWYAIFLSYAQPVDHAQMRAQRLNLYNLPDYVPRVGKANQYGFDPTEQRTRTFTGMGDDINVHDQWAVESMGSLQDRSREHLGHTDVAIRAFRRQLQQAIKQQDTAIESPLMHSQQKPRDAQPVAIDVIDDASDWHQALRQRAHARDAGALWRNA